MSDETTNTKDWGATDPERAGFCQDCGKPLTKDTVRNVGTGVFCEPCLTARVGSPNATSNPYTAVPPAPAPLPGEPRPGLAALLGILPGVGAMYNGQFAKGIAHLAIFAILVTLSDNVNSIFGLFVAGWIVYMSFEAHHTAVARRDGLPLPNAFGLNDIGERMGFGKGWGNVAPATPGTGPVPPPYAAPAPGYAPTGNVPPNPAPDWVGYVPPTAFASAGPAQDFYSAQAAHQAAQQSAYSPYAQTYTGTEYAAVPSAAVPTITPLIPDVPAKRFPVGAIWLIGLGVVILLANLLPDWRLSSRWWWPVLFAGLSIWTFTRRMRAGARLVCIIRWPVILMVLALMTALHAANFDVTFGLTISIVLITFGALLLLERTVGAGPVYSTGAPTSFIPPVDVTPEPRAAWSSTNEPIKTDVEGSTGGQA